MTPWLTAPEAAARLRCSVKSIYRAVDRGQLRAARIGGRRALRFLPEWVDAYAVASSTPVESERSAA